MAKIDYVLLNANDNDGDNIIQPFQLENTALRGRIVRLGSVLDDVLTPHQYPLPVAHLLGQAATLALLLSSMMKYEGVFTFQAQGDGPVSMLIADVTSAGDVRACATFRDGMLEKLKAAGSESFSFIDILGKGYVAFTVDQGDHAERYQGIVQMDDAGLLASMNNYFTQSEQIGTGIKLSVERTDKGWRAGAIMLQHMPEDDKRAQRSDHSLKEDWVRSNMLLASCKDDELTSAAIPANELLFRLFHEEGVRVYKAMPVRKGCRCTEPKLRSILNLMSGDDLEYMTVEGQIVMHCEFCSRDFCFDPQSIRQEDESPKTIN